MTTIADVIGRVNTQLKDTLWARWPLAELCDYFNDAIRAILLVRPDAGAVMTTLETVPGTRQSLPGMYSGCWILCAFRMGGRCYRYHVRYWIPNIRAGTL